MKKLQKWSCGLCKKESRQICCTVKHREEGENVLYVSKRSLDLDVLKKSEFKWKLLHIDFGHLTCEIKYKSVSLLFHWHHTDGGCSSHTCHAIYPWWIQQGWHGCHAPGRRIGRVRQDRGGEFQLQTWATG